jgi:hypothetical protein
MKTCTKCGRTLPLGEFYRTGRRYGDGRHAACRGCMSRASAARNRQRARQATVYRAQVEAMSKLVVTSNGPELVVDAKALGLGADGIRYWRLHEADGQPGVWLHRYSGSQGPLSDLLRGIADSYLDSQGPPQGERIVPRPAATAGGVLSDREFNEFVEATGHPEAAVPVTDTPAAPAGGTEAAPAVPEKITDLMAALAESVAEAKAARARHPQPLIPVENWTSAPAAPAGGEENRA